MPSSRTSRRACAALVIAASLGLAGCGDAEPGGGAVDLQAADGGPGTAEGGDGGKGGHGGAGGTDGADGEPGRPSVDADADVVASAPDALRACLTRNDAVVPWRTNHDRPEMKSWRSQQRQAAHERVKRAVDRRLRLNDVEDRTGVSTGFLGYDLDPVGNRLIMQVDPALIDVADFQRWVDGVAVKANEAAKVRGPRLTVTVQEGCFTVAEFRGLRATMLRERRFSVILGVALDGRVHAGFCGAEGRAYAEDLQRRVGPILAFFDECVYPD